MQSTFQVEEQASEGTSRWQKWRFKEENEEQFSGAW